MGMYRTPGLSYNGHYNRKIEIWQDIVWSSGLGKANFIVHWGINGTTNSTNIHIDDA